MGAERRRRSLSPRAVHVQQANRPVRDVHHLRRPSGEACVARREVSNTPLQALTLLNDTVFVEAAQAFGRQLAASPGSTNAKARKLWRRCLTRPPSAAEVALIAKFYETQRNRLAAKTADLAELAGDAEAVRAIVDRAAWTAAARAVLNLDEMVTRD